jgi:hypothetical protein
MEARVSPAGWRVAAGGTPRGGLLGRFLTAGADREIRRRGAV